MWVLSHRPSEIVDLRNPGPDGHPSSISRIQTTKGDQICKRTSSSYAVHLDYRIFQHTNPVDILMRCYIVVLVIMRAA